MIFYFCPDVVCPAGGAGSVWPLPKLPSGLSVGSGTWHEWRRVQRACCGSTTGGWPPGGSLCLPWQRQNHPASVQTGNQSGGWGTLAGRANAASESPESANILLFCFSSVCLRLVFLQVFSILAKAFTASWTSMQTDSSTSQWERWELLSLSGQSHIHKVTDDLTL